MTCEKTIKELNIEIETLKAKLAESDETLRAITSGEVDALVVSGAQGEQVFTLKGADETYRILIEEMKEGAVTLMDDNTVLYCNMSFANLLKIQLEKIMGAKIVDFVASFDQNTFIGLLENAKNESVSEDMTFVDSDGNFVQLYISLNNMKIDGSPAVYLVATDVRELKRVQEELRKAHDALELRVKERTAQLLKVNNDLLLEINERKLAESTLRDIEGKFRSLVDSANSGIFLADDKGMIIACNKSAEYIFQYSEKEILGEPITVLMPERYREAHIAGMKRANSTGEFHVIGKTIELHGLRKNGTEFPIEISLSFWKTENGIFYSGIIQDITERKRTEESLAKELDINKTLADISKTILLSSSIEDISSLILDEAKLLTGSDFGYVGYIEPETGYLVSPTMTREIWDVCNVTDKNIVFKEFSGLWGWVLNNKKSILVNTPSEDPRSKGTPKGHIPIEKFLSVPAMAGEKLVGQIALANPRRDYTNYDVFFIEMFASLYAISIQRKFAEDKLRLNGQILETMSEGVILIRAEDGLIVYANPKFENLFGYEKDELITKHISSINAPDEKNPEAHAEEIIKDLKQKGEWRGEIHNIKKDGIKFWCYANVSTFEHSEYGKVWISVHTDITERRQAEEELRNHREHLEELVNERTLEARLAKEDAENANMAKTNFLHTMSHELRTPLNAVLGFSEMLKQTSSGKLNEKQERFIDNIITGGNNLHNILGQILDVVKMYEGTFELHIEKIAVPETVNEVISVFEERASKKNVILEKNLDPELEYLEADKQIFKTVLINLLDNAVKFSKDEGGTVSINAKKEGDMARFSVSDRGIGIKEENIEKIFWKFSQLDSGTSRKYSGAGIGLAITKQLVELHGGKIWAESIYGEGTTFIFTLPLKKE